MSGWWLASFLIQWAVIVVMAVFLIGLLRQFGALQLQLRETSSGTQGIIPVERDGPPIGSRLPDVSAESVNGFGRITLNSTRNGQKLLLMFMNTTCGSCQRIAEPLTILAADRTRGVQPIVIMQADEEACRTFLSLFPINVPVLSDAERVITRLLDVHRSPFGMLYAEDGVLLRKAAIGGEEFLLALLGEPVPVEKLGSGVFPLPAKAQSTQQVTV